MSILGPSKAVVSTVWNRDNGRCANCGTYVLGTRGINWSVHHRRPRGMGGSTLRWINLPANLIILCGSGVTGCHGAIESNRADSYERGFLIPFGVLRPDETGIEHAAHGCEVFLDDEGGFAYIKVVS